MFPLFIALASIFAAASLRWWLERVSVNHVKGPPSPSFWLGHQRVLRSQDEFGNVETKWCREYGAIYRIKGCFGDVHRRQRKILNPAFSPANLRNFLVIFQQCSDKVVNAIRRATFTGEPIDVVHWMSKVSLDIIGLSAFRYDFGSLDGRDTELQKALKHLLTASWQSDPSALELMAVALIRILPNSALKNLKLVSTRGTHQLASVAEAARKVAREILATQAEFGVQHESDKDLVDILCKSTKTFLIAGHETTATTLSWLLYELAAHPDHQSIIREEVKHSNHGDYDSLPFLNAAIKETLRLHPFLHTPIRAAPHDDILPLSGSKTLAIPKGQTLLCSVYLYNRLPSIWNADAEEWNPARFLEKSIPMSLGVYANLMTFSTGSHSCIGWRFAVMEMQTVLANLIQNFEFSLPEGVVIQQFPNAQAIVPVVKGEAHLGSRVPLRIKSLE
ncbi:cytochrome P450 [Guyanagaster necrorhizus]|uniref:Cytochrome P450 n=1 Tax=Guyanagaster necrorhizus TaxID=856835 RepID=A0A9P8ALX5_9AGAR|nr:cytochrome P450 [Guyanagaster necrorhizus MCA 3950]KAG7440270.1 cytochrome P450 [Guyanagaster necrorhizus MCA 3950]